MTSFTTEYRPTGLDSTTPAALLAGEIDTDDVRRPLSVFDLMRIGIGPSSSHTVGPMRAGRAFAQALARKLGTPPDGAVAPPAPARLTVELFGSLGATGRGHATDRATLMGLAGYEPETVPTTICAGHLEQVRESGILSVPDVGDVPFSYEQDLHFLPGRVLPYHVNGMTLSAYCARGHEILARTYYSVGGGFVMEDAGEPGAPSIRALASVAATQMHATDAPHPFNTGEELLAACERSGLRVSDLVLANEVSARPESEVVDYLDRLRETMHQCIQDGIHTEGTLPGGLGVQRRAKALHERLHELSKGPAAAFTQADPLRGMDWVDLFALAVNEENAAGHRVVTAPTNGGRRRTARRAELLRALHSRRRRRRRPPLPAGRHRRRLAD